MQPTVPLPSNIHFDHHDKTFHISQQSRETGSLAASPSLSIPITWTTGTSLDSKALQRTLQDLLKPETLNKLPDGEPLHIRFETFMNTFPDMTPFTRISSSMANLKLQGLLQVNANKEQLMTMLQAKAKKAQLIANFIQNLRAFVRKSLEQSLQETQMNMALYYNTMQKNANKQLEELVGTKKGLSEQLEEFREKLSNIRESLKLKIEEISGLTRDLKEVDQSIEDTSNQFLNDVFQDGLSAKMSSAIRKAMLKAIKTEQGPEPAKSTTSFADVVKQVMEDREDVRGQEETLVLAASTTASDRWDNVRHIIHGHLNNRRNIVAQIQVARDEAQELLGESTSLQDAIEQTNHKINDVNANIDQLEQDLSGQLAELNELLGDGGTSLGDPNPPHDEKPRPPAIKGR